MSYTELTHHVMPRVKTGPYSFRPGYNGLGAAGGCGGCGGVRGFGGLGAFNQETGNYTVEQGDYVAKIAQKMGCNGGARELINANPGKNLGSGKIYAGQQIAIPPTCGGFVPPIAQQQQQNQTPTLDPVYPQPTDPLGPFKTPSGQPMPVDPSGGGLIAPGQPNPIPDAEWGLFGLGTAATIAVGLVGVSVIGGIAYFALSDGSTRDDRIQVREVYDTGSAMERVGESGMRRNRSRRRGGRRGWR